MNAKELDDLIERCLEGQLSQAEAERLSALLVESHEARARYWETASVHGLLEQVLQQASLRAVSGQIPLSGPNSIISWIRPATAAAAAAVALVAVAGALLFRSDSPREPAPFVATLALANACEWEEQEPLHEGQRLAGQHVRLRSGTAVLRFDGGAKALLHGPADIELKSRSRAALRAGSVVVRAQEEAAGFVLETPASQVTDLGTEFAVRVEPSGATEVHVLDGLVSYRKAVPPLDPELSSTGELLPAGHAIRYDFPGQAVPRAIEAGATKFDEAMGQLPPIDAGDALIARESFDYALDVLPLDRANGGFGWKGPWQPSRTWPNLCASPLPLKLGPPTPCGRLLDASNRYPAVARVLASPVRMDRDGVYYLSARVRWQPGSEPSAYMRQVRVVLRSSQEPKQGLYILNLPASCLCPQIQRHDLEVFTSRNKVSAGDLQRWVLKIVAHAQGEDELHFRVFGETESAGLMEPDTWHLSLTRERSDAVLDMIYLCTYLAPDPVAFGDLRLGTSWRSVVAEIPR